MPDLAKSLQGRDPGHVRIVAELWGIDVGPPDARDAPARLVAAMLDQSLVEETLADLPEEARRALQELAQSAGRLPWSNFTRRFGEVREMGAGRRDRERPYLAPISPAEALWYRGFVGRSFFDAPSGPEEFAYIPDDLLSLIPAGDQEAAAPPGRPAYAAEQAYLILANDRILDHACTLLAAFRLDYTPATIQELVHSWNAVLPQILPFPLEARSLAALLNAASLLDETGMPRPEAARAFLEASRGEALAMLVRAWKDSRTFDELRQMPGLIVEGNWQNDPLRARQAALGFLAALPDQSGPATGPFWSLPAFIEAIKARQPDFQRPAGDYDSWFLRDAAKGDFLRGFAHWDEVDGALVRYIICGPLHWLGVVDLATPAPLQASKDAVTAFRFSAWARALLSGAAPAGLPVENAPVQIASDARMRLPRLAPRAVRYQLARFSRWEGETAEGYRYRLTPASLQNARQQGLSGAYLLNLLQRHARTVPPSLTKSLARWETHGSEVRFERQVVLRLASPEILRKLRASRAARFLGDPLGPVAIIVRPGAMDKVMAVLAEMGYLAECDFEEEGWQA